MQVCTDYSQHWTHLLIGYGPQASQAASKNTPYVTGGVLHTLLGCCCVHFLFLQCASVCIAKYCLCEADLILEALVSGEMRKNNKLINGCCTIEADIVLRLCVRYMPQVLGKWLCCRIALCLLDFEFAL